MPVSSRRACSSTSGPKGVATEVLLRSPSRFTPIRKFRCRQCLVIYPWHVSSLPVHRHETRVQKGEDGVIGAFVLGSLLQMRMMVCSGRRSLSYNICVMTARDDVSDRYSSIISRKEPRPSGLVASRCSSPNPSASGLTSTRSRNPPAVRLSTVIRSGPVVTSMPPAGRWLFLMIIPWA